MKKKEISSLNRDNLGRFIEGSNGHAGFKHSEETKIKMSNNSLGKHFSRKSEFNKGRIPWNKGKKGLQKSPNWNGGIMHHTEGYILILKPEHPFCTKNGYVFEHRLVMEKHLGRYLKQKEVIHHINGNRSDNRIENLQLTNKKDHTSKHHKGIKFTEEHKLKMSISAKNRCKKC